MKRQKVFFIFFILLTTWHIAFCKIIHIPLDHATIQAGINASSKGDTILVADGIYTGDDNINIKLDGKHIVVKSENGPNNCIIDGEWDPYSAGFVSGFMPVDSTAVIEGFTIRRCHYAGIYLFGSTAVTIKNNTIDSCKIAINCSGDVQSLIMNNTITNNVCTKEPSKLEGAGVIQIINSSVILRNNQISNNTVLYDLCGIIYLDTDRGSTVHGNEIIGNNGVGIYIEDRASGTQIIANSIYQNQVQSPYSILQCEYDQHNRRDKCYTPVYRIAGGISVHDDSQLMIFNNIIAYNTGWQGGGIYCDSSCTAKIINNHIINNKAKIASGIYTENAETEIMNNIIIHSKNYHYTSGLNRWYMSYPDQTQTMEFEYDTSGLKAVHYSYGFRNNGEADSVHVVARNQDGTTAWDTTLHAMKGARYWMEMTSYVDQFGNGGGINLLVEKNGDLLKLKIDVNDYLGGCILMWMNTFQLLNVEEDIRDGTGIVGIDTDPFSKITYNDIYGTEDENCLVGTSINNEELNPLFLVGVDGNITQDPFFNSSSFELEAGSPCIDAGNPDISYNDKAVPPGKGTIRCDIGAFGGPYNDYVDEFTTDVQNEKSIAQPDKFYLAQNFPNPFNPITMLTYQLPQKCRISISLFNILGEKVKTLYSGIQTAGIYKLKLDTHDLPSGLYFYLMKTKTSILSRKCILLK